MGQELVCVVPYVLLAHALSQLCVGKPSWWEVENVPVVLELNFLMISGTQDLEML
jgi:hypothetical protein